MAQFRTTADIKLEVLHKAGEPINGNSSYDGKAMTYLNKAHQAIVGGGSIFSLKVDESFTWARAKNPIILELQPAFFTGTLTCVNEARSVTFSNPPTSSIEGWHVKIDGDSTVYKLTEHTASQPSGTIDSGFMGVSGTFTFKAFKLDYEISPRYLVIDSSNDRFNFIEVVTELTVSLTHGSYTPAELATHMTTILNAHVSTVATYTVTYDAISKQFTLLSNLSGMGAVHKLLGATGTNRKRSALPVLGFDNLDYSGAASYTSTYMIGAISRLIEPFKIFRNQNCPFITSTDPILLEQGHPLSGVRECVPELFAKITEDFSGTIIVRFNSYPKERMKVEVNWVEVPHDLQNNDASFPLIPRKEIDTLIHAAASFIMFDKSDSKFVDTIALVGKQLEAMEKKNRSELFRTGENFGQIVPRLDLTEKKRFLRYGYEQGSGTSGQQLDATSFPIMNKVTLTYADFSDGSLSKAILARTLAGNRSLFAVLMKHSVAFGGGLVSAATLSLGPAAAPTQFVNAFDVFQSVASGAQESAVLMYFVGTASDINATLTTVGGNLNTLTHGSVDIYFQELGVS